MRHRDGYRVEVDYIDCNGDCLNDMDGDGVCDEDEVVGCMQLEACNWNEMATDPTTAEFPGDPCDGDDTTINDVLTEACDCAGKSTGWTNSPNGASPCSPRR